MQRKKRNHFLEQISNPKKKPQLKRHQNLLPKMQTFKRNKKLILSSIKHSHSEMLKESIQLQTIKHQHKKTQLKVDMLQFYFNRLHNKTLFIQFTRISSISHLYMKIQSSLSFSLKMQELDLKRLSFSTRH